MENFEPQAATKRRKLPLWVYVVSFTVLIGFLVLIGKQLVNTSSGPIAIGQKVPEITLTTFDGAVITTEDLAGKVVVLNFWASWCKPCEQEAAELEQAWQMYKDSGQVVFLGVDWTDTELRRAPTWRSSTSPTPTARICAPGLAICSASPACRRRILSVPRARWPL